MENKFYKKVKEGVKDGKYLVQLQEINSGQDYIFKKEDLVVLDSNDEFNETVKLNQTELINKIKEHPKVVMSVTFRKQDTKKGVRAFKQEKEDKIKEVSTAPVGKIEALVKDLVENPLTDTIPDTIPGTIRVMKGYHWGSVDDRGRIQFRDMEEPNPEIIKTVDPRTVSEVIVKNVRYILK